MGRILALALAVCLSIASVSRADVVEYKFFPTGSPDPLGTMVLNAPPASSVDAWAIPFSASLDPNILAFDFDFTSVGGPIVTLGQFNNLFPTPDTPMSSLTGLEIDGGTLIGDSNGEQGQWGMTSLEGFDQARWISNVGGTPSSTATIFGDWRAVPQPATLAMLAVGGLGLLRRRRHG